jgi:starch phosphorylase
MNIVKKHYGNIACNPQVMEIEGFDSLAGLALDMRWSWDHTADELWQQLSPALWEQTHNPWLILQTVPGEQLQRQLSSPSFRARLDTLIRAQEEEDAEAGWLKKTYPGTALKTVAYFSMEFMLSEALPIYVGGLGNVAGDQLKSASDLGVPVIGVGLLYQRGYFRQYIDEQGDQQAYKPYNDPGQLPIVPLRLTNGEWLRVQIPLRGQPLWLRAWEVRVGRVKLYLLDSNDAANLPEHREITGETYGGGPEMRIMQEIVLGIGGWKLLEQLGLSPEVCHLNEGHAAFAVLERARSYMERTGENFEVALTVTRAGNLFTTHTAVAAGFDRFDPGLLSWYLSEYALHHLKISLNELLALGRQNPADPHEPFNMAYLAVHGSRGINGVSKLHGQVSRHLFEPLFQRWPTEEVPVAHITNGVHMPSWESEAADRLWTGATIKDRWKGDTETFEQSIQVLSDEKIWEMRNAARASLIDYIRERSAALLASYGAPAEAIDKARQLFDPNVLTVGFARRFVSYKRPDLLLEDPVRLVRLLTNYQQPVQLVIAGKAPPPDQGGKDLIKRWVQFIKNTGLSRHVIFLPDYDMLLAAHLVGGMDVWLNTPQRPWEASGTSGMKVLVNGGLNLSELDGWWVEAYTPEVGWALGDGLEHGYDPALDKQEAEALFTILEQQVAPEFYTRTGEGIPLTWIKRVRKSMASLTPYFSSNRTVREYAEKYYLPAAADYLARGAYNTTLGKKIVRWKNDLDQSWPHLKFGELTTRTENGTHVIEAEVFLNGLDPNLIAIELVAAALPGGTLFRQEMTVLDGDGRYSATVPDTRPAGDFTPRVIARNGEVSIPLEYNKILWQH